MVSQAIDPASSELIIISLSATLAGAVFGDHCSPISDTTVLSSAGSGCVHIEHVYTQLPYALLVAICALIGYIVAGFTHSLFASLSTAIGLMVVCVLILHARQLKNNTKIKFDNETVAE
jgi:Na+/H+ antiporter NhaC